MSEYKIGKIYKIIYIGNENINITYIGSTFSTLRDRWYHHKLNKGKSGSAITNYFKDYGFEKFKIFLIKEYEVCDRKHLEMYEQLWMNKMKCINKQHSFQLLLKEYKSQKNKEWRKKNNESLKEKKNKKYNCDCGGNYIHSHEARHFKTKKHLKFINQ